MSQRLADRLSAARRGRFVGRAGERTLFEGALAAPELPFAVLHVFGAGGVGKTTLLREYEQIAAERGVPTCYVDGRDIDPTPEAFLEALRGCLGLPAPLSLARAADALAARGGLLVLLLDTYETLAPLDAWLRERFLPELPARALIVLAGRDSPSLAWRSDAGWQQLVRVVPLRNLSRDEAREYLRQRAVPAEQHQAVLDFTQGHALALSLVADAFDQRPGLRFQPDVAPDVIKALLDRFAAQVPGPAHRMALEACALVRVTTEALLARMVAVEDAHELFDWLRRLSFIESGPQGLFPHDLARDALAVDLRWRNPERWAELHAHAREHYTSRLEAADTHERQQLLHDLIYLHRDSVLKPFFEWREGGALRFEAARAEDAGALRGMVVAHEGEESAAWFDHWLARQPEAFRVLREADGRLAGFVAMVALERAAPADREADPGARAVWRYLERTSPLRGAERATLFRFWMARDAYQSVSAAQSVIFIHAVAHYLTTPGLAFTCFPCADAAFWTPMFEYGDVGRLPAADFEVGGRRYGAFVHDWRAVPPAAWLELLAQREIAAAPPESAPAAAERIAVLEPDAFAAAVRDALRSFTRPAELRRNPLLRTRLVAARVGRGADDDARVAALQAALRETAEALQAQPREAKYFRALQQTYFQPALSQERAAALLRIPFATYRHHLQGGIERVTRRLWEREVGAS
ncbi:MAG TPA: hypothetical protein VFQ38_08415 [Longimicrobiales bacterium]|nr:hypothetical protein [Longimicrobiales bacterium]